MHQCAGAYVPVTDLKRLPATGKELEVAGA